MADKKIKVIVNSGSHEGVRRGEETEVTTAMMEKFPGKFTPVADLKAAEAAADLQGQLNTANDRIAELEAANSKLEADLKAANDKLAEAETSKTSSKK